MTGSRLQALAKSAWEWTQKPCEWPVLCAHTSSFMAEKLDSLSVGGQAVIPLNWGNGKAGLQSAAHSITYLASYKRSSLG